MFFDHLATGEGYVNFSNVLDDITKCSDCIKKYNIYYPKFLKGSWLGPHIKEFYLDDKFEHITNKYDKKFLKDDIINELRNSDKNNLRCQVKGDINKINTIIDSEKNLSWDKFIEEINKDNDLAHFRCNIFLLFLYVAFVSAAGDAAGGDDDDTDAETAAGGAGGDA